MPVPILFPGTVALVIRQRSTGSQKQHSPLSWVASCPSAHIRCARQRGSQPGNGGSWASRRGWQITHGHRLKLRNTLGFKPQMISDAKCFLAPFQTSNIFPSKLESDWPKIALRVLQPFTPNSCIYQAQASSLSGNGETHVSLFGTLFKPSSVCVPFAYVRPDATASMIQNKLLITLTIHLKQSAMRKANNMNEF